MQEGFIGLRASVERSTLFGDDIKKIHTLLGRLSSREVTLETLGQRINTVIDNHRISQLHTVRLTSTEEIVGMGILSIKLTSFGEIGYVDDIVADKDSPVKGIGVELMRSITNVADRRNLPLDLTCKPQREKATELYQQFGFAVRDTNVMRRIAKQIDGT